MFRSRNRTFQGEISTPLIFTAIMQSKYAGGVGMTDKLSKSGKTEILESETMEPEMVVFRYLVMSFLSESSKLLALGLIFHREIGLYLFSVLVLFLLRTSTGGMHCKRYWSCFLMSFTYLFLCINVLPMIELPKSVMLAILLLCCIVTYYIGPVISADRPQLTSVQCHRRKTQVFLVIFFYMIFMYILPENRYVVSGFWIVVLHAVQLSFAALKTKVKAEGGFAFEGFKTVYEEKCV